MPPSAGVGFALMEGVVDFLFIIYVMCLYLLLKKHFISDDGGVGLDATSALLMVLCLVPVTLRIEASLLGPKFHVYIQR